MNLRQYAEFCVSSIGLVHAANLRALRNYIKMTPMEQLRIELTEVNDPTTLKAIWEAGVPKGLQDTFLNKIKGV